VQIKRMLMSCLEHRGPDSRESPLSTPLTLYQ